MNKSRLNVDFFWWHIPLKLLWSLKRFWPLPSYFSVLRAAALVRLHRKHHFLALVMKSRNVCFIMSVSGSAWLAHLIQSTDPNDWYDTPYQSFHTKHWFWASQWMSQLTLSIENLKPLTVKDTDVLLAALFIAAQDWCRICSSTVTATAIRIKPGCLCAPGSAWWWVRWGPSTARPNMWSWWRMGKWSMTIWSSAPACSIRSETHKHNINNSLNQDVTVNYEMCILCQRRSVFAN